MVITLYGPFDKLAEKKVRIQLGEPISTQEMIRMLAFRYPGFARYADKSDDAEPPAHRGGLTNQLPPMGQLLSDYYEYRTWTEDGIPTRGKLEELGLDQR